MRVSPLGKSRLALEIKRASIKSKRIAKSTTEKYIDELSSVLGEDFFLVDYEAGCSFKFDMLHNANAVIGYDGKLKRSVKLEKKGFEDYLDNLLEKNGSDIILVYSNYPKVMPYIVTKLSCFIENYETFIDLLENEVSIISEDLQGYLEFNFDDYYNSGKLEIISLGEKYGYQ